MVLLSLYIVYCFFFQAEDGIRDRDVTGVQTCALPISIPAWPPRTEPPSSGSAATRSTGRARPATAPTRTPARSRSWRGGCEIGRASCRERGEGGGGVGSVRRKQVD